MNKSKMILLQEQNVPVLQIKNYLMNYFQDRGEVQHKYWINYTKSKYPEVPESVLIDIKNDVIKELNL